MSTATRKQSPSQTTAGLFLLLFAILFSLVCFGVPIAMWLVGVPLAAAVVFNVLGGIYQAGRLA